MKAHRGTLMLMASLLGSCAGSGVNPGYISKVNAHLADVEQNKAPEREARYGNNDMLRKLWQDNPEYVRLVGAKPPPRRFRLISGVEPQCPRSLSVTGIVRTVRASFVVGTDGRVEDARILTSDDDRLNDYVIQAMLQFKFVPAEDQSGPVRSMAVMPFNYAPRRYDGSFR